METLKNIKNWKWRNILIVSSVILFFIIFTYVVIIIAQGKRVTTEGIVSTSIIRLNVIPEDVTAYIDDEKANRVENRIENIEPGKIKLRFEKEGYTPWEKEIAIEEGEVRNIYAQLYPSEFELEKISNNNVHKIDFPFNTESIIYTVINEEDNNGIWRYRLNKGLLEFGDVEPELLVEFEEDFLKILRENEYNIATAPDGSFLKIQVPAREKIRLFNLNNNTESIELTEIFGYYPDKVKWFRNSSSILVEKSSLLFEYQIDSKESTLIDFNIDSEKDYTTNLNKIYFTRNNSDKLYIYEDKRIEEANLEFVEDEFKNISSISSPSGVEDILIINSSEGLYYLNLQNKYINKFDTDGNIIQIARNGKSILYEKNNIYLTYTMEDTAEADKFMTNISEVDITKDNIENIFYSANSTNLIAFLQTDGNKNLVLYDNEGQNQTKFFEDNRIAEYKTQITSDGNALYLLLKEPNKTNADTLDKTTDDTEDQKNTQTEYSIYRISLSVN